MGTRTRGIGGGVLSWSAAHVDDSLGQLVSIYGSKELFINEYRNMLAERLLNKVGYDIDRETHTLELLKLRFGESSLHKCEVMLKDMNDSKRINGNVKAPPRRGRQPLGTPRPRPYSASPRWTPPSSLRSSGRPSPTRRRISSSRPR